MSSQNETIDDLDLQNLHSSTLKYATIAYLALMTVLGTVGNVLVILTVIKTRKFHRLTYILIANLSMVGLLVCLIILPSHIINIVRVGKIQSDGFLCELEGYLNFMLTLAMIMNSVAITLSRYVVVNRQEVRNIKHERPQSIVIILVLLWSVPLLIAFSSLPFTGYHDLILDCFFLISEDAYWYVIATISAPGIITTVVISVCYSLILKKVRNSRLKVTATLIKRNRNTDEPASTCSDVASDTGEDDQSQTASQPSTSSICCNTNNFLNDVAESISTKRKTYTVNGVKPKRNIQQVSHITVAVTNTSQSLPFNTTGQTPVTVSVDQQTKRNRLATVKFQQEVRLTLQLLLVFTLFCCLYMPICVVHILYVDVHVSPDLWLTFFTLALSFSTTTWILYGALNRDFRKAYMKILSCKK